MTDPAKSNPESDAARSDAKTADQSREDLKKAAEKSLDESRGKGSRDKSPGGPARKG